MQSRRLRVAWLLIGSLCLGACILAQKSKELFGFDRTRAISTSPLPQSRKSPAFGTVAPQADDITVLTVAYTGL